MNPSFKSFFKVLTAPFSTQLWLTSVFAAGVSISAVSLLGISGWFLTGAAIAGAGGPLLAQGFNYLLPSAAIRFFAISRTVLRYGERYFGHSAALRAMAQLRPVLLGRILNTAPDKALSLSRGETSSRFIQDVAALENALIMQSAPPAGLAGVIAALVLTGLAGWWPLMVLLIFMTTALVSSFYIHRHVADTQTSEQAAMGAIKAHFFGLMALLPDIRAYDMRAQLLAELRVLETQLLNTKTQTINKAALSHALITGLTGLCLAGTALTCFQGSLPLMALALLAASMGFESIAVLSRAIDQRAGFAQARRRVAEVYEQPQTPPEPLPALADMSFHFHGVTYPLNADLRLRIDGPSGSGKTRLIEALMGMRALDGLTGHADMRAFTLCPQDATLITATVRDNLTMALSDEVLKTLNAAELDSRLFEALEKACLKTRILAMPHGLATWIGDGGVTLSGGERKRLALARSLLRDAPILILDEPTEGLDRATEAEVIVHIAQHLKDHAQGLILISHREGPRQLARQILGV